MYARVIAITRSAARISRARPGIYAAAPIRHLHQDQKNTAASDVDSLTGVGSKGRTGGGQPLDSSSENAPPQPKITNQSVPGDTQMSKLSEEQRREVEEHNRDFAAKHDRGPEAPDDKVDKKFWSGEHR
ncbi:hypothetical protein G7Z17_g12454 [Cylindrodendrum hubeiense]|uniref:Uncharacterized protein n=1 Tax=Cylindrodendrum hubeiense TaxID=595255 RepID=A0A9P5LAA9_9HYPO|nr:hypothetical protein G7Z17_g12454 [Cylindrodendrum hubeiense]